MFRKRHPPAGSRPGTLMVPDNAPPPRITAIRYTAEAVEVKPIADAAELEPLARATDGVLWVDVQGLGDVAVLETCARIFDLHTLALEDVVNVPQRPKTERYDAHQLYISRMVKLDEQSDVDIEQVSVFIGERYVLTFQERYGDVLDPVRRRIHEGKGPLRKSGADYLAYAIIDTIIDYYYPALDRVSETLESLESRVLTDPSNRTLESINRMKRTLLDLRRGIWPQRDAINSLVHGDSPFVRDTVQVYLRDSYDHAVQIADVIDTYRELAAGLFNTYLSAVSNRMNEVMKVLTIMASVFIPLTFLAGIYGMNFEGMPELRVQWAYPLLLALMVIVAGGMMLFFWRKGWIGPGRDDDRD